MRIVLLYAAARHDMYMHSVIFYAAETGSSTPRSSTRQPQVQVWLNYDATAATTTMTMVMATTMTTAP